MAEFCFRVFCYIGLYLLPVSFVIADFFTIGTDRQDAAQCFDLFFRLLLFREITNRDNPNLPAFVCEPSGPDLYGKPGVIFP